MDFEETLLRLSPEHFTIWVHHVGGGPDTDLTKEVEGPLTTIPECRWVVYDAQEGATAKSKGEGHLVVPKAVGDSRRRTQFYITAVPSASSMYLPSQAASDNWFPHNGKLTDWGTHSKVQKTVLVEVDSIDSMVREQEVPPVDFLSVDAQGAEGEILKGASWALYYQTVGVIIEAEFYPLYEGQGLFCDTMKMLVEKKFRLVDLFSAQNFHTASVAENFMGPGFLTVAEPFYLRQFNDLGEDWTGVVRALKIAAVAMVFHRRDYAWAICRWLEGKGVSVERLAEKSKVRYISMLRDLMRVTQDLDTPPRTVGT